MILKLLALITLVVASSVDAAVAIPDGSGTYTIFQKSYVFFKCSANDLSDSVMNPLFCGDRSLEKRDIQSLTFKRNLLQKLKEQNLDPMGALAVANELVKANEDFRNLHVLTLPQDKIEIQVLAALASDIHLPFSCSGASCPQLDLEKGWSLVSVNAQKELWRDVKTNLVWGEIFPREMNFAEASKSCGTLNMRLPTVKEAEVALSHNLRGQTNCGKFYNSCLKSWYWSETATPYGEHFAYPMEGSFMKLVNMDSASAAARCVSDKM